MSNWIDFDMLMSEIGLHRNNAQRRILHYRDRHTPPPTCPNLYTTHDFIDRFLYENEVGAEHILMCLQRWVEDFKFSDEEVKKIIEEEEQKYGKDNRKI